MRRSLATTRAGLALALALAAVLVPVRAGAVTLQAYDARVNLNLYLDVQYTYMGRLPKGMETSPGVYAVDPTPHDGISTLDQERLNLILKVDRDRFRANVNLYSHRAFASDANATQGEFQVMEAYGEYRRSREFNLRGGTFLVPFGIFNEIRYAISLFAPVVLPTVYEPMLNYELAGGLDHLVPDEGNLMVSGAVGPGDGTVAYAVYMGSGHRTDRGTDRNEDKSFGAQLTARLADGRQKVGASFYTSNDEDRFGRRRHGMVSLDLKAGDFGVIAESLWVRTSKDTADVFTYYVRIDRPIGRATPFVGYDYIRDRAHPIYGAGMVRWSIGVGFEASSNLYLKAEYHLHVFDEPTIPDSADTVHMVRLAGILVF
jgi:hypothetical protein